MQTNPANKTDNDHDLPPSDDVTRKKIDKHLRDKEDKISEEDLENINTTISTPLPDEADTDEINEEEEKTHKAPPPDPWDVIE